MGYVCVEDLEGKGEDKSSVLEFFTCSSPQPFLISGGWLALVGDNHQ